VHESITTVNTLLLPISCTNDWYYSTEVISPTGDIVGVFAGTKALADRPVSGVVTRCSETTVSVAFDSFPQSASLSSQDGSLVLIKLANDITYSRIKRFGTVCMYLDVICYTLHGAQASVREAFRDSGISITGRLQ